MVNSYYAGRRRYCLKMEEQVITERSVAARRKLPEKMEFDGLSMNLLDMRRGLVDRTGYFADGGGETRPLG